MAQDVLRAEIPLGPDGLFGSRNYATTPPTNLINARNIDYYGGVIQKEGGAQRYVATPTTGPVLPTTATVLAGQDWWPDAITQQPVVFTSDGRLVRDDGNGNFPQILATGLNTSATSPVWVEGGKEGAAAPRKLFLFTGTNAVRVVGGVGATSAPAIATPPADWSGANQPTFGFNAYGRLWGGGNANQPHVVYYSTATDHENFTAPGSGFFMVYPGVGERLLAGVEFKGFVVLFKYPRGIYLIDMRDASVNNWTILTQSRNVGLCGPNAWCMIDDDILFMDTAGQIQVLSRVGPETYSSQNLSDLKQMRDFIAERVDTTRLWDARAVYYAYKREVHFALSSPGSTVNDRRLVIDLNIPQNVRYRWSDRDVNESIWLQKDTQLIERPTIGADGGQIWRLDIESRSKEGGYEGLFQTAHMDFSHLDPAFATRDKNGKFLEIMFEEIGDFPLYADIYWDERFEETLEFRMGADTGGFTYTFPIVFARRGRLATARRRLTGSGRRFSVVFRNAGNLQNFRLSHCYLGFSPGTERN